jgi:enoyl-CoA hydratase/carnithine racemase
MKQEQPHVHYQTEGGVAILTLNRPEAKNAFSEEMLTLWQHYLVKFRNDDKALVLITTGSGDTFCSGGNIRDMAEGKLQSWNMKKYLWEGVHRIALAMEDLDKPVIAAINGAAMGAGLDMALMCDMRICSDRAKLSESYILMGLVPGDGGAYFLPRIIGQARAMELLLTADIISPMDAERIGLVNRVVKHETLTSETMKMAQSIAAKPAQAVRMMKRAVQQSLTSNLRSHLDYISSQLALLSETKDHQEAARAFLEKRKPIFTGS